MLKPIATLFATAAILVLSSVIVRAADALDGTQWTTDDGQAVVAFAPCKVGLCGKIVSLVEPNDANGKPLVDHHNPDLAKRGKPIIGLATIYDVVPEGDNIWRANSYDPRNGEEHEITLTRNDANLVLKGCGLGGLICQSFTWTLAASAQ